jgi:NTP pyrophosphatase (non-canonical NTP hydrolase)
MKMNEYQLEALKTKIYPREYAIVYPALGLAGESGEVCEKIKKHLRGDYDISGDLINEVEKELGDVLWYIANLATDLGLNLDNIASKNIDKLRDRERRNVIKGDGDDR